MRPTNTHHARNQCSLVGALVFMPAHSGVFQVDVPANDPDQPAAFVFTAALATVRAPPGVGGGAHYSSSSCLTGAGPPLPPAALSPNPHERLFWSDGITTFMGLEFCRSCTLAVPPTSLANHQPPATSPAYLALSTLRRCSRLV
jgi:hypothetical protein